MKRLSLLITVLCFSLGTLAEWSADQNPASAGSGKERGNRLAYLDPPTDPFYPDTSFPRLETPQWVGEEGVEAVIVLSVDDLRDPARHEQYLRPILERLKSIDGRAPVSLMACTLPPSHPVVEQWLNEGLSIEVHTITHPCPLLQQGDFSAAKRSYEECIDLISERTGVPPCTIRIPCCDSMNSPSPRFFAEIFPDRTPLGRFLAMDSSVFVVFTQADANFQPETVVDEEGRPRFSKYIPPEREMANFVENYPYPYVIGNLCWEIPALMPSDWNAQHLNGRCSPLSLRDWEKAVDAVVAKCGIWALCFHPHGWIAAEQVVALVDYVRKKFDSRVRFLTFREVLHRLEQNLLKGQSLRDSEGKDNGVRILDINADGWMDVVIANDRLQLTRIWQADSQSWHEVPFPTVLTSGEHKGSAGVSEVRFGVIGDPPRVSILIRKGSQLELWSWHRDSWQQVSRGIKGLAELAETLGHSSCGDAGIRFRDLDGDGICELLVGGPGLNKVFRWKEDRINSAIGSAEAVGASIAGEWVPEEYSLPGNFVDGEGRDNGLRLVDLDGDGDLDVVLSNSKEWLVARFESPGKGWNTLRRGKRDDAGALPAFVDENGANLGAWFRFGRLWIQNEHTGRWVGEGNNRIRLAADWLPLEKLLVPEEAPMGP
jgi:hypothetical protein